jgi:murein DD-endopeptidase MepM/ murein hydrolase activator NlpD
MSRNRPRFSQVVHRIPPGSRPPRKRGAEGSPLRAFAGFVIIVVVAGLAVYGLTRPASPAVETALPPGVLTLAVTALPSETPGAAEPVATPTPEPPEPTSTFLPPSPSPTAILTAQPTQMYLTRSGDTLPALAARFGVNPADIAAPQGLRGQTTLAAGQALFIPRVLGEVGPDYKILPDSEVVFSAGGAGFEPQAFARQYGGYLAAYEGYADRRSLAGGDLTRVIAEHHSVNPRLLVALIEYQSSWLTNPSPTGEALKYPLGYVHEYRHNLYSQLNWAANQLETGYYGWRAGTLTEVAFRDGSTLRLDPALNAGTAALQYFFSLTERDRAEWEQAVGREGFAAAYRALFGDPFARAVELIPADLTQPPLELPFLPGHTWYYSGGPHGAWQHGGALAALDFAPASEAGGCAESPELVTAVAPGKIVRANDGSVVLDLDGDGREETGWAIFYLHIAERERVRAGTFVETGDFIGHPSCEGGSATGTHVHLARKYNGEWIPAGGLVPFNLSGWIAGQGAGEYLGTLSRDGVTIQACTCTSAAQAIRADP